jgi:signal transduction histidine kinase
MEAAMNATVPHLSLVPQARLPMASPCADPGGDLAERYWRALQEHLADGSDTTLGLGEDLARQAQRQGLGVLELAESHAESLHRLWALPGSDRQLRTAANFFARCLAPFDTSQRGAHDGARALRHLNDVLEGELRRVAQVLHDEAGQLLALVHIAVADVAVELPPKSRGSCARVQGLLAQVEAELRGLAHEWRPPVLAHLGLLPALESLAEKVTKRTGIRVAVAGDADVRMPPGVEVALYRIVQEALNNAVKHAAARSVWIGLQCTPHKVTCSVRDDGKGFDPMRWPQKLGLGLAGIRERITTLGGSMQLETAPSQGTTVQADIPFGGEHARTAG